MTSNEIAEAMSEKDARLVTGHMRNIIASVTEKLDEFVRLATTAYERRIWVALGYESWDVYVSAELRTERLSLERDDRRELVAQLRSAGMSTRAIGSAVGVGNATVHRDLESGVPDETPVSGADGKTYSATQPPRGCSTCGGTDDHLPDCAQIPQTPRAQALSEDAERKGDSEVRQHQRPVARPLGESPTEHDRPAPSAAKPTRDLGDVLEERMPGTRADLARTSLRARWAKDIAAVADIDLLDMEQVRSLIDDSEANLAIRTMRQVADRLERAGRPGLRVVGGTDG